MNSLALSAAGDGGHRDERVLVLAPTGRDAALSSQFLAEGGLHPLVCDDIQVLCQKLVAGCGLVLLAGEVLHVQALSGLRQALAQQPSWSDVPLVVLTSGGGQTPANADVLAELVEAGNVTLIERPVRAETLLSTVKSARRARRRQYDVRDHLAEEMRAKDALRLSEERLRIALDAAQLGAWQLDPISGRLDCTPMCKAHFGLPPEAHCTAQTLLNSIHVEDRQATRAAVFRAFSQRNHYRWECRVVWPDGSLHWILASGRTNHNAKGEAANIVGVTLDITERKKAEHERETLLAREQAARADAESASRLKDEFLATVSHELRTPLTAILGWANLMRTGQVDESTAETALETIERNARAQVQLINDLLDVSRIVSGKLRLEMKPIELAPVIAAAVNDVRPAAEVKRLPIEVAIDPQGGLVLGDAERLQQVVWNLLTNAVKFTPPEGQVKVCLESRDSQIAITVSDTGKGIHPKFLSEIFDRFRQADQTSTRRYGGLGLGLSIARQLVELHDGTVEAHSDGEDQGTTFTVLLPHFNRTEKRGTALSPAAEVADARPRPPRPLINLRVLIVDDEADTRSLLQAALEGCHSRVRAVSSAAQALEAIAQWQPDVLVSDVGMPGEDGYSLIRKVREMEPPGQAPLPSIALTAYVRKEDEARALKSGFHLHLAKPIEPADFVHAVAHLVQTQRSLGTS